MAEREINISPLFKWLTKRFDKQGKKVEKAKKVEKVEKVEKAEKAEKVKKMRKTKLLSGRKFKTVKKGLDEEQVVDFVNDPVAQYGASLDPHLETMVTNAEQLTASIKMKAQAEAEAEATRIISQAKQEIQEIKLSAEIAAEAKLATENEAEDILSTVKRKTEIIEAEAKQRTLLYLLRAREEIEKQIREDYKKAYARLSSSLQDLMSEGQNIEVELKNKRTMLWESKSFELKEYEATLLETSEEVAPPPETLATEEEIEQPVQLQEEVSEEKTEQPAQPQEEAPEEKIEQPVQLQEEAPASEPAEEKTEQPAQLQEEATASEPAEEITEQPLRQHPPEEIPAREEASSTQLRPGDSQTLYAGEIELAIAIPVELKMVSKLYNYLQTIPDIKILRTTGSWDRGTTITVVADKPTPLISLISEIPDVEVIPELPQEDSSVKGRASLRLRGGGKGVKTRIELTLKEA
jgi:hypothetical protein